MNILVIEDAAPDRRRFRILLDHASRRLRKNKIELGYEFAWDANQKEVSVVISDEDAVRRQINSFDHVFLDLAWFKREEDVMNRAKRQSETWLFNNADRWTAEGRRDLGEIDHCGNGLIDNISGFKLLEVLNKKEKPTAKIIIATGFYSKAIVHFCADRWNTRAFKKWEDQEMIEAFMYPENSEAER